MELLLEAGLPEEAIACVTEFRRRAWPSDLQRPACRKISFTGSVAEVGIQNLAGWLETGLRYAELGSNSPVIGSTMPTRKRWPMPSP